MLELEGITKNFGGLPILDEIKFQLSAGQIIWLKGANGAGKTTLLKIIAGIIAPDSGKITKKEPSVFLGDGTLIRPTCTVKEFIDFWSYWYQAEFLAPIVLNFFGLDFYQNQIAQSLSAGWKKRLLLCLLMLNTKANLWLLDEVIANLDEEGIILLNSLIEAKINAKGAVILTSHQPINLPHTVFKLL